MSAIAMGMYAVIAWRYMMSWITNNPCTGQGVFIPSWLSWQNCFSSNWSLLLTNSDSSHWKGNDNEIQPPSCNDSVYHCFARNFNDSILLFCPPGSSEPKLFLPREYRGELLQHVCLHHDSQTTQQADLLPLHQQRWRLADSQSSLPEEVAVHLPHAATQALVTSKKVA